MDLVDCHMMRCFELCFDDVINFGGCDRFDGFRGIIPFVLCELSLLEVFYVLMVLFLTCLLCCRRRFHGMLC